MRITDHYVATLRAQLQGRVDEHRRLLHQLDPKVDKGYAMLVGAAFFEAVNDRFVKDAKLAADEEIIVFVADVRARLDNPENLDPTVAETLIKIALDKLPPEAGGHIRGDTVYGSQIILLGGLIGDARPSDDQLDAFLAKAREMAEEMLS